ncbi:MAG TPA: aminoacyl-histidine dipeptidase [Deltaproteobacteria bacterium]|nr:aminoacyl-histidine dipeptidase [Deltaproteobacteria bacterium]
MRAIQGLLPEHLWRYFEEVSQIPRESGKEDRIRDYLVNMADRLSLEYRIDSAGNVLVLKDGTPGTKPLILQAHMDMVCEKDMDTLHDFNTDPIRLVRDGKWIKADGTTLGADNGIGMAAMLAIMEETSLVHPSLELLFTIEEETGLTGAYMLTDSFITGKTLINLDSEDDDTLYIGCAGGRDTDITMDLALSNPIQGHVPAEISITGLKGGHSGLDIHKGRGNAIKLLNRFMKSIKESIPYHLATLEGGTKHNAIPRDARAVVYIKEENIPGLFDAIDQWNSTLSQELHGIEDFVSLKLTKDVPAPEKVILPEDTDKILTMISILPHGVVNLNESVDNMVITSTNLAICSVEGTRFKLATNQRSVYSSSIQDVSDMVKSIGWVMGAQVTQHHDYPAWKPNFESETLRMAKQAYESLYGKPPLVKLIHAGLECAVIGQNITDMDMISLGPTVEQAHSPSERVDIDSVTRMWDYLIALLKTMAGT